MAGEAIDLASADLWLDQAVGHHVVGQLDPADALALTAKIKSYVGVTWVLIAAAHEHKAHKALGYKTWAEYVETEFDMSRGRSYQLISQAKVVLEISEVAGLSTTVDISEREARDLAPVVDEAKAAVAEAVEALPDDATDEERAAAASEAVEVVRSAAKQTHRTTETTTTTFDPETGEIIEGEDTPPGTGSAAGEDVAPGQTREASSASSSMPQRNPALVMMADLSRLRAEVAKWMAFDRHEQVIESMTTEQRDDYRSFLLSVFNHASATIDHLDAPARLKAVQ